MIGAQVVAAQVIAPTATGVVVGETDPLDGSTEIAIASTSARAENAEILGDRPSSPDDTGAQASMTQS